MVSGVGNNGVNAAYPKNKNSWQSVAAGGAVGLAMPVYTVIGGLKAYSKEEAKEEHYLIKKLLPDVDTFENTKKNIEKLLVDTGLKEKGVKFIGVDGSAGSMDRLKETINAAVPLTSKLGRRMNRSYLNIFS